MRVLSTGYAITSMLMQVGLRMNEVLSLDVMHACMHAWMNELKNGPCRCALLHPS